MVSLIYPYNKYIRLRMWWKLINFVFLLLILRVYWLWLDMSTHPNDKKRSTTARICTPVLERERERETQYFPVVISISKKKFYFWCKNNTFCAKPFYFVLAFLYRKPCTWYKRHRFSAQNTSINISLKVLKCERWTETLVISPSRDKHFWVFILTLHMLWQFPFSPCFWIK